MLSHNTLRGSESGFPGRNRLLAHNSFLQLHPGASEKFSSAEKKVNCQCKRTIVNVNAH